MSHDVLPAIAAQTAVASVLDPDNGAIDAQLVAWLEERYGELRHLLMRTARDLVTIGQLLAEVKAELAQEEFLAFVAALGMSRATAYRWMKAAAVATGRSHIENVEPSALYALSARSTPDEVRESFLQRADAGHQVTLQDVQATLRQQRPARDRTKPNLVECIVDGMVDAEYGGAGQDWRGRDMRAERIADEIDRFGEEVRTEVAAAVAGWGQACIEAAQPFLVERDA